MSRANGHQSIGNFVPFDLICGQLLNQVDDQLELCHSSHCSCIPMHVRDVEQITKQTNNNLKRTKSTTKPFQIWVMSFRARVKSTAKDVIYGF